ncbi:1,4-alpha-glucan-branching enzyme, partial [bacterium]
MKNKAPAWVDPYLLPHLDGLKRRHEKVARLLESLGDLCGFADAHQRYGLHRDGESWRFCEWAPHATEVFLVGDFSEWRESGQFRLTKNADGEFLGEFPARSILHGQHYKLSV